MHHDNNPSLPDSLPEDLTTDASPPVSSSPSPETATGAVGGDQITDNSPQATWLDDVNLDLPSLLTTSTMLLERLDRL